MSHIDGALLHRYVTYPTTLDDSIVDVVEHHIFECGSCRERLTRTELWFDVDRSWGGLEQLLRAEFRAPDRFTRGVGLDDNERIRPTTGRRAPTGSRRLLLAAATVAALVIGLAWIDDARQLPPANVDAPATWEVLDLDDSAAWGASGDVLGIAALLDWRDELLVVGQVQSGSGQPFVAWTSSGGGPWSERTIDFPDGCDPWGGVAVVGAELLVACVSNEPTGAVVVASTQDLDAWAIHEVGTVSASFSVAIGSSGDGTVAVVALEPADPDTVYGARMRVWIGDGTSSWVEGAGVGDEVFRDAFGQRVRVFGDDVVIVGSVNTWPDGSSGLADPVAAAWTSNSGAPFARHLLPHVSGAPAADAGFDVTATDSGLVVVGGRDGSARAWYSAEAGDWEVATVIDPQPLGPGRPGAMWTVAFAGDGDLVAGAVGDPGVSTPTWVSRDGGRRWQPAGDGPSLVLGGDRVVVGVRTTEPFALWRMELR